MDKFGDDNVSHNLPLLILSGLEGQDRTESDASARAHAFLHEGGFRIKTNAPTLQSESAALLLETFLDHDGSKAPWKAQSSSPREAKLFRIRNVGRTYTLPARKAPPPPQSPRFSPTGSSTNAPPLLVLHSPLSPLTPSSPLYPDGIVSSLWIAKHQSRLPCAFLACFALTADANTSSLQDNKTKSEINDIRGVLSSTSYKTKFVAILLADCSIAPSDLEDRLGTIRKSTGLDSKSLFFLRANASRAEVMEFTAVLLTSIHPSCLEYYRDLSKHARRKRNRSSAPPPTVPPATGYVLPQQGWNVRYEFKLGVLAEFRQEMDAACRNYESAYDNLFSPEMIESIAVWSPRFNEARLLADTIAIRIIRCLLWTGQNTSVVRSWASHRERIQDLMNRRGKGTDNYGWEAWQSTWSKTMADLLRRSELSSLTPGSENVSVFAGPEKPLTAGERVSPWDLLHHEGYWLDMSQSHTKSRRNWSMKIPLEDRQPPGRSPASVIASRTHLYDTYLTLEPHVENPADEVAGYDYVGDITSTLESSVKHFALHGQIRMCEILEVKKALQYLQTGSWERAFFTLTPLWKSHTWRRAGWWKLLQQVGWALLECANQLQDGESVIRLTWELASSVFAHKSEMNYDLQHVLDGYEMGSNRVAVAIDASETASRVIPSFAFVASEGHVGEPLECQFVLRSCSQEGSAPWKISEVKIVFDGSLRPIYLSDDMKDVGGNRALARIQEVALEESPRLSTSGSKRASAGAIASLTGSADLNLSPGQTQILNLTVIPREAGEVSVAMVTLMMEEERYSLTITTPDLNQFADQWWEVRGGRPRQRPITSDQTASQVHILPKPPKMKIEVKNLQKVYYTNEDIDLQLEITNDEEEPAVVSVASRLISPVERAVSFKWSDTRTPQVEVDATPGTVQSVPHRELGILAAGSNTTLSLSIADTVAALVHELEVVVSYKLQPDQETVLTKALVLDVGVIRPFEANYNFSPRLNMETWPSFFEAPLDAGNPAAALGLKQRYRVHAGLYSFATDAIIIEAILLTTTKVTGGATCFSTTGVLQSESGSPATAAGEKISTQIESEQTKDFNFDLLVQKLVLGDRQTVGIDLALEICWRRPASNQVHTSILEVPHFIAPMAEPRVMLTVDEGTSAGAQATFYTLRFLIENPSIHFLTFNVALESSENFAFSGPKACAVSLVPISRHEVKYHILPNKKDEWVKVQLNVVDAYFGQTLRVQAAGDGVKVDKKGNVLVYVG